jgi:hypothetical protein
MSTERTIHETEQKRILYIASQAEHHQTFSFQEEVRELLKQHRMTFDERYVWD